MRITPAIKWILVLAAIPPTLSSADTTPRRISWGEFSTRVSSNRTVQMALPDGTLVEGQVLRVNPDGIDIHVTRTSNQQAHPKGNTTLSRNLVSGVGIRTPHRRGRLIGTLVPIAVGSAIAAGGIYGYQGSDTVNGYALAGGLTAAIGAPVGFFVGRAIDRRFERFVIVSDPPSGKQ